MDNLTVEQIQYAHKILSKDKPEYYTVRVSLWVAIKILFLKLFGEYKGIRIRRIK